MTKSKRIIKILLIAAAVSVFLGCLSVAGVYFYLEPKLPKIDVLEDLQLQEPMRVYAADGKLIAQYGDKRRIPLSSDEIPELLKEAFISAEDDRYYVHPGVDWQGLVRAAMVLATTGSLSQGGSTITMQAARGFFLTREKKIIRKLNEIILALKMDAKFGKDKILELYLNKIFLGKRAYGVAAAAQVYYGKAVHELTLAEMAMIAGLPKAPSRYNPIQLPERALTRRNYVLGRMLALEKITQEMYDVAKSSPITAKVHIVSPEVEANYVGEMARAEVAKLYPGEEYNSGLRVFTTINSVQQSSANLALRNGLLAIDQRQGYRGTLGASPEVFLEEGEIDTEKADALLKQHARKAGLRPAIVQAVEEESALLYFEGGETGLLGFEDVSWARNHEGIDRLGPQLASVADRLSQGDVVWVRLNQEGRLALAQLPEVEGALIALSPEDGRITALVGGFDFFKSKFNRATQAKRQAGSSFKPFLYAAALENGYTPASIINDAPVVFDDPVLESKWKPENYSGKFYGPTRLRAALANSRNLVSIRLLIDLGIVKVRNFSKRIGFPAESLPRDLSLALGSGTVTPLELVSNYAVLANGGFKVAPYLIDRIEDASGNVIYQSDRQVTCLDCLQEAELDEAEVPLQGQETGAAEAVEVIETDVKEDVALTLPELEASELPEEVVPYVTQAEQVLPDREAYLIRSMLQDVVRRGTARRALRLGRTDLAGKTGTTNDQIDAWFTGFNDDVVASVWVGYDELKTMGRRETGSSAALPIWVDFMEEALLGSGPSQRAQPEEMVSVRIDPVSGLLASPEQPDAVFELFRVENVPTQVAVPEVVEPEIAPGEGVVNGIPQDEELF